MRDYLPLNSFSPANAGICTLTRPAPNPVTLDSPALEVMTDLAHVAAVTIEPSASVLAANEYMIARAVRSLFVVSQFGFEARHAPYADGALFGLRLSAFILPCTFFLLAAVVIWAYPITARRHAVIQRRNARLGRVAVDVAAP